ncbi:MAG TPA: type II toxin-antitoxin system prevent-host-death family antitoxin [Alkalispirochaeta sp.]|nr:type II toxin-antitoxin system prevent-host-death family antitoxin [Alkalispirochaeta sp.]
MANVITANDLKTKGVSTIDEATSAGNEVIITVRGKPRYVVMSVDQYHYLRECELEAALAETRHDVEAGRTVTESVEEHIARITDA